MGSDPSRSKLKPILDALIMISQERQWFISFSQTGVLQVLVSNCVLILVGECDNPLKGH